MLLPFRGQKGGVLPHLWEFGVEGFESFANLDIVVKDAVNAQIKDHVHNFKQILVFLFLVDLVQIIKEIVETAVMVHGYGDAKMMLGHQIFDLRQHLLEQIALFPQAVDF